MDKDIVTQLTAAIEALTAAREDIEYLQDRVQIETAFSTKLLAELIKFRVEDLR